MKTENRPTKIRLRLGDLAAAYEEPCPGDPDTPVTITATWTVDVDSDDERTCQAVEGWAPGDFSMAATLETIEHERQEADRKAEAAVRRGRWIERDGRGPA